MEHAAAFGGKLSTPDSTSLSRASIGGTVEQLQDGRGGGPVEMPAQDLFDPRALDGAFGDEEEDLPAVAAGVGFEPQQAVSERGPQLAAERLPGIGGRRRARTARR